jgi:hypothetical protein
MLTAIEIPPSFSNAASRLTSLMFDVVPVRPVTVGRSEYCNGLQLAVKQTVTNV